MSVEKRGEEYNEPNIYVLHSVPIYIFVKNARPEGRSCNYLMRMQAKHLSFKTHGRGWKSESRRADLRLFNASEASIRVLKHKEKRKINVLVTVMVRNFFKAVRHSVHW